MATSTIGLKEKSTYSSISSRRGFAVPLDESTRAETEHLELGLRPS
jgi:hypothetical protein